MARRTGSFERRSLARERRRVLVRYGPQQGEHLGFTTDLGEKGLFLQGNHLFPPQTRLRLEIGSPEAGRIFQGVVRWVKQVPPAFRRSLRGGMGIQILSQRS